MWLEFLLVPGKLWLLNLVDNIYCFTDTRILGGMFGFYFSVANVLAVTISN